MPKKGSKEKSSAEGLWIASKYSLKGFIVAGIRPGVREAMDCLVPDGGSFIRAYDAGVFRSLTNREFIDFLEALQEMPWSWRNKAQGRELTVPLTVNAE